MSFRFLNIPVNIHPTFWIFVIFFTNIYREFTIESVILGFVLFLSLLVHEYGHALTARRFGANPTINLEAFGGYAQYNSLGMTPKQQFLITLNGPLLESVLIFLSYSLLKSDVIENHYFRYFLYATLRLNILWCLLNLMPIAPLDGGHLLRYLLEKRWGAMGTKISAIVGLICVIAIAPYFFVKGYVFFAMLLLIYGYHNYQALARAKERPEPEDNQFHSYITAVKAMKSNEMEKAKAILEKLLKSKNTQIKHSATESLATLYFMKGMEENAYQLLLNCDHQELKEGKVLLCNLAFKRKNFSLIARYSWDVYALEPAFETALMNAKVFAYLKDPKVAAGWLETASQFGPEFDERVKELLLDPDFESVSEHLNATSTLDR